MKKLLPLLILLTLVGAGCAKSTPKPAENQAASPITEAPSVTFETTNPDGTKSTSDVNVNQNGTQTKPVERDKDGVPIIEVTLGGSNSVRTIDIKSGNYFFEPKTITAKPGEKLRIDFRGNEGFHTFVIDEIKLKETVKDGSGFEFTAPTKPGSYPIYCDVGQHQEKGMEGVLIVK